MVGMWVVTLGALLTFAALGWKVKYRANWPVAVCFMPLVMALFVYFVAAPAVGSFSQALAPETPGQIAAGLPNCPQDRLSHLEFRPEMDDRTEDVVAAFRMNGWQEVRVEHRGKDGFWSSTYDLVLGECPEVA